MYHGGDAIPLDQNLAGEGRRTAAVKDACVDEKNH
jgi:hypothetical protein